MDLATEEIRERLQDIVSMLCVLEADMEQQKAEEVHLRMIRIIHRMVEGLIKDSYGSGTNI